MEDNNGAAIDLIGVTKVYPGGVRALDDISLKVDRGDWLAVMGPSGSGKTTLLNLLDGLDKPDSGDIHILGVNIALLNADAAATFRRENMGLIFQQFHLIPYLTSLENVMLAQYYHSIVDKIQALRVLEDVQMGHRSHHRPSQLSGGEQQRVCIARALVNDPAIILADEPTGNLDAENEDKVLDILRELHRNGRTIVVVTHDRKLGNLAQRIVTLQHGTRNK